MNKNDFKEGFVEQRNYSQLNKVVMYNKNIKSKRTFDDNSNQ